MPYFAYFGILGLVLLWATAIVMFLAKQRNLVHLRRYHPLLGTMGVLSLAVHAVWVNLTHLGEARPLLGWLGLLTLAGVLLGYFPNSLAKRTGDRKWRKFHWPMELGALVIATFHAVSLLIRILGR